MTVDSEHAHLTSQPSEDMIKAGAERIQQERMIFLENNWGEPCDRHLAANAYEAMVFFAIKRGLHNPDIDARLPGGGLNSDAN